MKFRKGEGGRPAGIPNKISKDIRLIAGKLFDAEYWTKTKERLRAGELHPAIEKVLLAYAYGEPLKTVKVSGDVTIEDKRGLLQHLPDAVVAELAAREAFDSQDTDEGTAH